MSDDILLIDKINALQPPLFIRKWGNKEWWWPVYDIGVDVALVRIDVCGMLDRLHFADVAQIKDGNGDMHNPDDFYNEAK